MRKGDENLIGEYEKYFYKRWQTELSKFPKLCFTCMPCDEIFIVGITRIDNIHLKNNKNWSIIKKKKNKKKNNHEIKT